MQEGHPVQDLLGQPDHVFLREGVVVIGDALVEDFATGGAAGEKAQEGKTEKNKTRTRCEEKHWTWIATQRSLVWLAFILIIHFDLS